jgi:hypothetical protein
VYEGDAAAVGVNKLPIRYAFKVAASAAAIFCSNSPGAFISDSTEENLNQSNPGGEVRPFLYSTK